MDGDGATVNCLRWLNYGPYDQVEGYASWGNLEMADDMPAVSGASVQHRVRKTAFSNGNGAGRYFSLKGRPVSDAQSGSRMLVKRMVDGTVQRVLTVH